MSRTNIEIEDELIAAVMRENHIGTKREAVAFALRKARLMPMTVDEALAMEGIGWEGDLEQIKGGFAPIEI